MEIVFGIDISATKSDVAVLIDGQAKLAFTISNDKTGFNQLDDALNSYRQPLIIFEATGVYSRRLANYLMAHNWVYTQMNPLAAKKAMDSFRHIKTDTNDARMLAQAMSREHFRPTIPEQPIYRNLRSWERIYQNHTEDLVRTKNRLHRALQIVFPGLEHVLSKPSGLLYWQIVSHFAHPAQVKGESLDHLVTLINGWSKHRLGASRSTPITKRLIEEAKQASPAESPNGPDVLGAEELAQEAQRLTDKQAEVIETMTKIGQDLPELDILTSVPGIGAKTAICIIAELGDIRRFHSANAINAYVGIDLVIYESGGFKGQRHIRKCGNAYARKILYQTVISMVATAHSQPTNISRYYQKKKQFSQSKGTKKIAIAAMARLIRTIYHLVRNNESYDSRIFAAE